MRSFCLLLVLSFSAFITMGYHPGTEDDGVYLTAVKGDLDAHLCPQNADFFRVEMRSTLYDEALAEFVRATHIPLNWATLTWQFISIFAILAAGLGIVRQLFQERNAQWASVAVLSCLLTLPVSGTGLYIVDQYLHPRAPATALILFAISSLLRDRVCNAVALLSIALLLHPIMGLMGVFFCLSLGTIAILPARARFPELAKTATNFAILPFGWLLEKPAGVWLETLNSRHWYRLYQWTWYEWLGAVGPLAIFWLIHRHARRQGNLPLSRLTNAILIYGLILQGTSMLIMAPGASSGLGTLEPMRYLHLVYIFLMLIGGAYIGKYILGTHAWRWALLLGSLSAGMFAAQRQLFASTEHLELPGRNSSNSWLQAFAWIRANTPVDAYFALDPDYLRAPGEDAHNFRALAERSALADAVKDASVVTKAPELAPVWQAQMAAQQQRRTFRFADYERLKNAFGVDWVLVSRSSLPNGLDCRWHNQVLAVCRIP